ncbi:hypothetical protein [Dactylosporangium sp. CA-092794]|uniref:hypothetical protein n=1 Tax=Dactylosporangium sp. CA-092794 TaxID=3239929 RepID=UPI003D8DDBD6
MTDSRYFRTMLLDALRVLQGKAIGGAPARMTTTVDSLTVEAQVTAGTAGTLALTCSIRIATADGSHPLAGTPICVGVDERRFSLGTVDDDNSFSITGMPPGSWRFDLRARPRSPRLPETAVPLPQPAAQLSFAAPADSDAAEVLRVVTPGRRTLLVLRRTLPGQYLIEATRPPETRWRAVVVEYTAEDGDTAVRVIPLPASSIRASGTVRLDAFFAQAPWQALDNAPVEELDGICSPDDLAASAAAAHSAAGRQAWRDLAVRLTTEQHDAIHRGLGAGRE